MYPLLLCSITSLTIAVERAIFWWRYYSHKKDGDFNQTLQKLSEPKVNVALDFTKYHGGDWQILRAALDGKNYQASMKIEAQKQIRAMKRGLAVMDTIVTAAPLLGILGTVLGIIQAFDSIGGATNTPGVVQGIGKALITTAAGLTIAIFTLLVFNYLLNLLQRNIEHMEEIIAKVEQALRNRRGGHEIK